MTIEIWTNIASYIWMGCSIISMLVTFWLRKFTNKTYHSIYIFFFACCALWGFTNVVDMTPVLHFFNSVILVIAGGVSGVIGLSMKLVETMDEFKRMAAQNRIK